jgi:hypothetical protein
MKMVNPSSQKKERKTKKKRKKRKKMSLPLRNCVAIPGIV